MKRIAPPSCLDSLLRFLLPPRNRETVAGDLYEEFLEVKQPQLGYGRACLWYVREVLSFVPARAVALLFEGPALRFLCICTALAGCWLGIMDILLRHPGWIGQTLIAAMIVFQAFLTLAALRFYLPAGLYAVVAVGSAALLWLAGSALKAALSGADFEGYVLLIALALIALALIAQAVLSGVTLPRMRATRKNA